MRVFSRGQLVKVHPRQAPGRAGHRPRRPARGADRLRDARPRRTCAGSPPGTAPPSAPIAAARARAPAAVDQDAPGLRPAGPGQEVGPRPGRQPPAPGRWRPKRSTSGSSAGCSSAATENRPPPPRPPPAPAGEVDHAGRFARDPGEFAARRPTRAPKAAGDDRPHPTVSPELRALLRRVKLGRCLDTLPERLALAKTNEPRPRRVPRAASSPTRSPAATPPAPRSRARTAGLDPTMTLDRWDATTTVTFDQAVLDRARARCGSSTPATTP